VPTSAQSTAGASTILISQTVGSATNELGVSGTLRLMRPSEATFTRVWFTGMYVDSTARTTPQASVGERLSAADVDAIQFFFASGTVESGLFTLYGVKRST